MAQPIWLCETYLCTWVGTIPIATKYPCAWGQFVLGHVGWYGRAEAVIISRAVFFVTLPFAIISRGFAALTGEVFEAARTLSATEAQVFRTVLLPLITPYLITGLALVTIISVNEYLVADMIAGFVVETLPITIFNNVRYGCSPVVASDSILFVAITVTVFVLLARVAAGI